MAHKFHWHGISKTIILTKKSLFLMRLPLCLTRDLAWVWMTAPSKTPSSDLPFVAFSAHFLLFCSVNRYPFKRWHVVPLLLVQITKQWCCYVWLIWFTLIDWDGSWRTIGACTSLDLCESQGLYCSVTFLHKMLPWYLKVKRMHSRRSRLI